MKGGLDPPQGGACVWLRFLDLGCRVSGFGISVVALHYLFFSLGAGGGGRGVQVVVLGFGCIGCP